ncbi:MAG: methylmalonyl-CoA epimerase [Pseudomonadota bacterium]|nr:methylmalonyl-CoA epimerase [Pseudomonadota bacterium]
MITRFNHVAIVVPDLKIAAEKYKKVFNANVSQIFNYDEHGVSIAFIELGNTKIELMHPYGANSPIRNFLKKNDGGAIHHICIEVKDINAACNKLTQNGIRILGDKSPKIGAHDKPVVFLHPKDFYGTLIELEQE